MRSTFIAVVAVACGFALATGLSGKAQEQDGKFVPGRFSVVTGEVDEGSDSIPTAFLVDSATGQTWTFQGRDGKTRGDFDKWRPIAMGTSSADFTAICRQQPLKDQLNPR